MIERLLAGEILFVALREDIKYDDTPTMQGYNLCGFLYLYYDNGSFKFKSHLVTDGSYFDTVHEDYVKYIVRDWYGLL